MKQISDVETTTSSRPALLTVLMASGLLAGGEVETRRLYHGRPGASTNGHAHPRLLRPPSDPREPGARRRAARARLVLARRGLVLTRRGRRRDAHRRRTLSLRPGPLRWAGRGGRAGAAGRHQAHLPCP